MVVKEIKEQTTVTQIEVRLNPDVPPTGSDLSIVNAARRSFNTRSEWGEEKQLKPKDKRLLEFLARGMTADDFEDFVSNVPAPDTKEHKKELIELLWQWRNTPTHDTPFNHAFMSFEVKAPIFVRAQLVKHEYLVMSEFSRRYITEDIEFYEPDFWRKAAEDKKQGSTLEEVDFGSTMWSLGDASAEMSTLLDWVNEDCQRMFTNLLEAGVAPEQARMVLPQSTMTEWTWSGTLGAFAKMCTLRLHPEAQYEARLVAQQVYDYMCEYFPVGAPALVKGV